MDMLTNSGFICWLENCFVSKGGSLKYISVALILTSSQASKLRQFETTTDRLTHLLTRVKSRATSVAKKTSFSRCLELQMLDIEKLFRGRSGPTNGYLSAYLMHPVMHGGPDGTLLMINLRCAAHHHTVDRLIVLYDAWHGALYRQPGACSSIFFLSSKSLQKI